MTSATIRTSGATFATIRRTILTLTMTSALGAAFGFTLMTAYWPGIAGAATTPRWLVGSLLVAVLYGLPRTRMTAAHWLGAALVVWLAITLIWSEGRLDGADALLRLLIAGSAFAVGSQLQDLRPLIVGAALGIGVSSALAIAQWCGWHAIEADGVAGLFYNRDRLAAAAALVAIAVVALARLWPLLPLLAPSLALTQSRAAWLALAAGMMALPMRHPMLMWPLRVVVATGALITMWGRGIGLSDNERGAIWSDTVSALNNWGHGLGSFWETFPAHAHVFDIAARGTRPDHPHSEWLWLQYEGGYPAVLLFMAFALSILHGGPGPLRAGMAAILVLATFAMPFHDPATVILGALCAGFIAGQRARDDEFVAAGGMALRAGMAAGGARSRAF